MLSGSPKMWLKTCEITKIAKLKFNLFPFLPDVFIKDLNVLKAVCVDFLYDSLKTPSNDV